MAADEESVKPFRRVLERVLAIGGLVLALALMIAAGAFADSLGKEDRA